MKFTGFYKGEDYAKALIQTLYLSQVMSEIDNNFLRRSLFLHLYIYLSTSNARHFSKQVNVNK